MKNSTAKHINDLNHEFIVDLYCHLVDSGGCKSVL